MFLFNRLTRPRFTGQQTQILRALIDGELSYINDDAPDVCLFDSEEQAEELLETIKANS